MYFEDYELECHCDRCKGNHTADKVSPILREHLESLRSQWGAPINVSCAYRCPEHNAEVGGVAGSTHERGFAADIYVGGKMEEYEKFYQFVLDSKLFDGVGHYPAQQFCHVDVRSYGTEPNTYRWEG